MIELNHVGLRMLDWTRLHLYRDTLGGQVILNALSLDGRDTLSTFRWATP